MFFDFRELEAERDIEADLCIIGAGAAGITLARSLIGSKIQVCLLESGGFEFDEDIQALYEGDDVGSPGTGPTGCRLRYFGGTTNHWTGWCGPLGDLDFELRPWVSQSGWPISKKDLDPYYVAAQKVCELDAYRYDLEAFSDKTRSFPVFDKAKIAMGFWQLSPPTRFGSAYREELEKAENVRVYLYANVTDLQVNETPRRCVPCVFGPSMARRDPRGRATSSLPAAAWKTHVSCCYQTLWKLTAWVTATTRLADISCSILMYGLLACWPMIPKP